MEFVFYSGAFARAGIWFASRNEKGSTEKKAAASQNAVKQMIQEK